MGFYTTSFFEMFVDTENIEAGIEGMCARDRATFFHEYIHFIQDFTTHYGLNSVYCHGEYVRRVVTQARAQNKLIVPHQLNDNNDNVLLNKNICEFSWGDKECCKLPASYVRLIKVERSTIQPLEDYSDLKMPDVTLTLNGELVTFGACAVMESMAYIMERCCAPNDYEHSPDFPYRSAEMVADYYVPNFSANLYNVLALCDVSLQTSVPGSCFVDLMIDIKKGKLVISRPEDIYDYFYKMSLENSNGDKAEFIEKFNYILTVFKQQTNSYLQGSDVYGDFHTWVDRLARFALKMRCHYPYYLLDMAREGTILRNRRLSFMVRCLGTPMMKNNDAHLYKMPAEGVGNVWDAEYFKAFYEVERVFSEAASSCTMIDCCKAFPRLGVDERCTTAPWKRCSDPNLCPFAHIWHHWGLCGLEPQTITGN